MVLRFAFLRIRSFNPEPWTLNAEPFLTFFPLLNSQLLLIIIWIYKKFDEPENIDHSGIIHGSDAWWAGCQFSVLPGWYGITVMGSIGGNLYQCGWWRKRKWVSVENWEFWYFLQFRVSLEAALSTIFLKGTISRYLFMKPFFCWLPGLFSANKICFILKCTIPKKLEKWKVGILEWWV